MDKIGDTGIEEIGEEIEDSEAGENVEDAEDIVCIGENVEERQRRGRRDRHPPAYLSDYDLTYYVKEKRRVML